jgi:hypothetical protein
MWVISRFVLIFVILLVPHISQALEIAPAKVELHASMRDEIPFQLQFDAIAPQLSLEVLNDGAFESLPEPIISSYELVLDTVNDDTGFISGRVLIDEREEEAVDEFLLVARERSKDVSTNLARTVTARYRIHHGQSSMPVSLSSVSPLPSGFLFGMPSEIPELRLQNTEPRPQELFIQGVLHRNDDVAAVLFDGSLTLEANAERIAPQLSTVLREDALLFGHYTYQVSVLVPSSAEPITITSRVFIVQPGLFIAILTVLALTPVIMAYIRRRHAK